MDSYTLSLPIYQCMPATCSQPAKSAKPTNPFTCSKPACQPSHPIWQPATLQLASHIPVRHKPESYIQPSNHTFHGYIYPIITHVSLYASNLQPASLPASNACQPNHLQQASQPINLQPASLPFYR
jgi:hypothetical protein